MKLTGGDYPDVARQDGLAESPGSLLLSLAARRLDMPRPGFVDYSGAAPILLPLSLLPHWHGFFVRARKHDVLGSTSHLLPQQGKVVVRRAEGIAVLSALLVPLLRVRYPDRGLTEGVGPDPCAVFPGIHSGIRSVSIYDDGDELTLCVDDLTHGHFNDYTDGLTEAERELRIVDRVLEFLDALFADQIVVWGQQHMGGWYRPEYGDAGRNTVIQIGSESAKAPAGEFVWSGPYPQR
jgi:hypothetical protein